MKKIVGILAVAAMATSMFAADVSAATKISGKLFSYDEKGNLGILSEKNESHDYANPNFAFSVSGDKAGAALKITTDGGTEVKQTTQTIWFKPVDALKLTVGNYDVALNKETIDWTESWTGLGSNGFLAQVNVGAFGLDLGLDLSTDTLFVSKADGKDAVLKTAFAKAGYSADFGSIGAYVMLNAAPASWKLCGGYYNKNKMDGTLDNIDFGAGYKNSFGPVTAFVNVVAHLEKTFEWIRPEVFVTGNVSGFGFNLFAAPVIVVDQTTYKKTGCEIVAKFSYPVGSVTPYVYFKDANILADTFASTIKVGATGSVGAMGWNTWVQIETGKANNKVAITVPFELTMSF